MIIMAQQERRGPQPGQRQNNNRRITSKLRRADGKIDQEAILHWLKRLWNNYVVRNVIVAAGALLILAFIASLTLKVITRHNRHKEVPEFVGTNINDARKAARKARLHIEINDSLYVPVYEPGVILEQNPQAGTQVKSGRNIFVTINSFSQKKVDIPYVKGYSLRQAKNILETAGLEIDKLVYVSDMATNYVLEQSYKGKVIGKDSKIVTEMGSGITLKVGLSGSARPVAMPRLAGLSLRDAKSRLWENGFNVGKITYDEGIDLMDQRNAKVYEQSIQQGRNTPLGTTVSLKLTLDTKKINKGVESSESESRAIEAQQAIADSIENAQKELEALIDSEVHNTEDGGSGDDSGNDFFE